MLYNFEVQYNLSDSEINSRNSPKSGNDPQFERVQVSQLHIGGCRELNMHLHVKSMYITHL